VTVIGGDQPAGLLSRSEATNARSSECPVVGRCHLADRTTRLWRNALLAYCHSAAGRAHND
jgi:hypothetical protein